MAHKKAAGSKARQGGNRRGKRLGVKVYGGEKIKPGQIITRQRGQAVRPGENVGMGKDHTLFALKGGTVLFSYYKKNQKKVSVVTAS